MVPLAVGVVVALSIRSAKGEVEEEENLGDTKSLRLALTVAGALVAAAFLGGIGETAMQALLPLYGLAHGVNDAGAAQLVAVFSLGEAVLVAVLGWMADRYGRRFTLLTCSLVASATCALLPFVTGSAFTLWPVLFLAGGAISGIYTLGVILMGQDFRGQTLAYVSTGFAMAYAAGSIVGSTPVGYLIDVFGPEALPVSIAASFLGLTAFLLWPSRRTDDRTRAIPPARDDIDDLPEIKFDLSFLFELPPAALSPASGDDAPPVAMEMPSLPEIEFDLSFVSAEWDLDNGFRQRAAEVAERARQRQPATEDAFAPVRRAG
jgi:MFS family permease